MAEYVPVSFAQWADAQGIPLDPDCPECDGDPEWGGWCERCNGEHLAEYQRQVAADREKWDAAMALRRTG